MNNQIIIVGRPSFDLSTLRNLFDKACGINLTTHCGTSLSVFNKLISNDEYKKCNGTLKLHHYTLAVITDSWVLLHLRDIFDGMRILHFETKNPHYFIIVIGGTLFDFIANITEHCCKDQEPNLLSILSNMVVAFEKEGLGFLFSGYSKEKVGNSFYLEMK